MKKLRINLFTSLSLGVIALLFLVLDFIFFKDISNGSGNLNFELKFISYSFFVFFIFFISIFSTIYQTLYFLRKKVSKIY